MKRYLLAATDGTPITGLARVDIAFFTTRDDGLTLEADTKLAALELKERIDRREGESSRADRTLHTVRVCLEDAEAIDFSIEKEAFIRSRGSI
jgi:hypothetical protein